MGLIRLLMFALAAVAVYAVFRRWIHPGGRGSVSMEDERLGRLVQDPNCLVYVDSQEAVRRKVPDGELFFCSESCAEAYLERQCDTYDHA